MIGRVTQQTLQRSTLANLQLNLSKMSDLQAQMSSGKKITKPSDDPAGTAQALSLRAQNRATTQYQRNAQDGEAWLTTIDTAMQTSVTTLRRVRDLVVQSGSGALNATGREALATEIEGLRDSLLGQANTSYLGRSVFAGSSNAGAAFRVDSTTTPPTYTWTGSPDASVQRRLAPDTTVRADADGSAFFGDGATSVFTMLDDIAAGLRAGTDVTSKLDDIDTRTSSMLGELSNVGTRTNQIKAAQSNNALALQDVSTRLSGVEDIDLAQTVVELQMQEVAYKGALGATARVLQPTLMDFLR
ncbi:flagellar hook-associated protein FlgL [Isoptericola sp. b441]|uniref:Flagellar hook-associated protein FlgL n=1 Tax=Actinotalea lenta TaxID=3064654 RepID=A0ABT9D7E1_9CELL|nr:MULTISPECIES: flagellar hook-associated protein FlgL [unclassified Isoptericola]MDO8106134.1 flagellar hook-associated protein FlgL [Isoptericola sp. b441]MDO8122147.1 flagellar hook-associated protein FlgL [Isoptericola sp. b490]